MKILVIDGGGRGHALVSKLAQSPQITEMWCAPGNVGVAEERLQNNELVQCLSIQTTELSKLLAFAIEKKPDLTIVGGEEPLALGIVDLFELKGLRIWGPNQAAAQFESSKIFAQKFMVRHSIPTPDAGWFHNSETAVNFARSLNGNCFVKADGLALGKGSLECRTMAEASDAIEKMLTRRAFGSAGERILIQERLEGREVSLHVLCDGNSFILFPPSQDHKRAGEGGTGLNTGGMGALCPAHIDLIDLVQIGGMILEPWLKGCIEEDIVFKGLLYPGIMLTRNGPRVLEFNARFGDPEAQVYLTRLENDLVDVLQSCLTGKLDRLKLKWRPESSVCVVMASGGYPESKTMGKVISGIREAETLANTKVFHADTVMREGNIVTNGGRVLGVTSWGRGIKSAREQAYRAVEQISFETAWYRKDIGANAL